jgi:hypothetical protein
MSDFGAIIIFRKKVGSFSSDDKKKIEKELKKVITEKEFPSNITEGNFAELRGWDDDAYCSMITEYYDDEDAEEIREFAEEEDIPDCELIIKKLTPTLESDFEMEAKFEDW